jgi:hypothetical protein
MAAGNYAPGSWLGIVRSRTAVILGSDTPPALVRSLWELLENGPEAHEVLSAVTSSFGVSLARIPSFGIVDFRDPLRVFLRGDLDLTVGLPGGSVDLNGRDVTTWTERHFAAPEWFRLTLPGGGPGTQELPVAEGVVLLQYLNMALARAAIGPSPFEAQPVEAEPVEPQQVEQHAVELEPVEAHPVEPEPVLEQVKAAGEHGASAETVIGVLDDDPGYSTGMPESPEDGEPAPGQARQVLVPDQMPAHELTGTYDHLWERTVVRSIEDAAMREDPEAPDGNATVLPPAKDGPEDVEAAPEPPAAAAAAMDGIAPAPMALPTPPAATPPAATSSQAGPLSPPLSGPAAGGLIESVPWRTGGDSVPKAQTPPLFTVPAPGQATTPGSQPRPMTTGQGAADRAGVDGASVDRAGTDAGFDDADHDGQTVMKSDLAGMAAHPAPTTPAADAAGPLVLARVCGQGHANPPTHAQCAACGLPLASDAVQVARPRLGRMRVSSGELVDLDQSLVIGRQPSVSRVQGGVMPRLVQVASPSGDISRSHVEVRLEGWHVMLCDLKATNGTVLVREGQPPRRLAQNEMAILLDGDIAEIGDDISLRFEEIL